MVESMAGIIPYFSSINIEIQSITIAPVTPSPVRPENLEPHIVVREHNGSGLVVITVEPFCDAIHNIQSSAGSSADGLYFRSVTGGGGGGGGGRGEYSRQ